MNELQIFNYESNEVRMVMLNGEPWFVLKDVCKLFGETNYRRIVSRLDDDEKGVSQIATPGGNQGMTIVNESGLYHALFTMQPEKARGVSDEYIENRQKQLKAFKRWVTHKVLPAIRKTGTYSTNALPDAKATLAEAKAKNARARVASMWLKLAQTNPIPEYQQICAHYASAELTGGEAVLPLPEVKERTYSAAEVGALLGGISANKVGRTANQHGLKTLEYGVEVWDKSKHSSKQVPTWRYNEKAVERLRELLGGDAV